MKSSKYWLERLTDTKVLAACAELSEMLAKPTVPEDGMHSGGECFEPWDLFRCVYGSYSSEFDEMAIAVLNDIEKKTYQRTDIA